MDNQQKLNYYKLMIDMVKKTTSTMESDSILQFILDGIISVLPCVDVGVLYIYDDDKDLLKMVATHNINFSDEYPYLKPGDSVSGKCFLNRDCIALNSTEIFVNYMDRPSTYMKSFPDANLEYPYSAMTCCLIAENKAVGAVIVYNYADKDYIFTEDELELLHAAADHAAITIAKNQIIKQMEESNQALATTVDVQINFVDIILNSNGFANILEYLKKVIVGEIALYDVFFQELYRTYQDDGLRQLIDNIELNYVFNINDRQCLEKLHYRVGEKIVNVYPIIIQKNLIGYLIIIISDRELSKKDEAILNHVTLVIALEWLKNDAKTKTFSDISNKFLDYVLTAPIDANAVNYAKKLGLDNNQQFCLSIIKSDNSNYQEEVIKSLHINNIINIIKHTAKIKGIVFARNEDIYIIYYGNKGDNQKQHHIDNIEDQIIKLMNDVKIVRGGVYGSLENIRKSYHDAEQCVKMITDYDMALKKIDYDAIGIWKLLLKLDKIDLEEYAYGILKNLVDNKTEKNKDLLITLGSFIKNDRSISKTAKELNLHNNSVYFRLKKIEESIGLKLNNDEDWLSIQLSCSIIVKCNKI